MGSVEQCHTITKTILDTITGIDYCEPTFQAALFFVVFNPLFWNIVSRIEYYTRLFSKIAGGPRNGCYMFAFTIFSLGMIRSYFFEQAMRKQVVSSILDHNIITSLGIISMIAGQVLVLTSMYQLGITGTYNGDYFGILMKGRVYDFPFNVCHNPMYRGSTLSFLGMSLIEGKAAGLFITLFVHLIYDLALKFEEPFTMRIYSAPKKD